MAGESEHGVGGCEGNTPKPWARRGHGAIESQGQREDRNTERV